ncbi:hypothetical protein [Paraburkholderia dinghuensis]|uniref:Uncharacterized protein n=1 Tax=Paraburkholderia dinghuensis TaxID=2305225 RepID=A0A3N6MLT9_9BURK|nr:hypothetical protein [Paraburkholderia dinghuensis]RQH04669.1 hypothetical protein D1Y85_17410 [Paraburkholderia dinghuensis]
MTSPIGRSTSALPSSLTSPIGNRYDKYPGAESDGGDTTPHRESTLPATPLGPIGHHINTTA